MSDLCRLIWCALIGLFRPRAALEAEILVLRHQLNILRRKCPKRVALSSIDRLLLVGLYRLAPGVLGALKIIRPKTLIHMIVFGEAHLRRILGRYAAYYNESRIHRSLDKDAPFHRAIERLGVITSQSVLGGLHHQYCRI